MDLMIATKDLSFKYKNGSLFTFPDWSINQGEQWLVTGASGSGKTTLLHLLAGLLTPASGSIIINNTLINKLAPAEMDIFRGKNTGLIFQKNYFIGAINMLNNLLAAQTLPGFKSDHSHVYSLLEVLEIRGLEKKLPSQLSEGELQRFAVARALANKPAALLADEPTSSLDDRNCDTFINLITENAWHYKTTLIIATHDARLKQHFSSIYPL
jgi:putative ABC transport system ATP-binding protein